MSKNYAIQRLSQTSGCNVDGPTAHWSDDPVVRKPIGPTAHWSENPLVRRPIDPKKCVIGQTAHWSEKVPLERKSPIGLKTHWSENPEATVSGYGKRWSTQIPFTEMSVYRNVRLPKCPFTEMSVYRNIRLPKCPLTGMSAYRNVRLPKMSAYRKELLTKCPVSNCPLPNCPLPKCPLFKWLGLHGSMVFVHNRRPF